MTTTTPTTHPTTPAERPACVLPPGADFVDDLTVAELGIVGRQLRCDPLEAVASEGKGAGLRWEALARIAWVWSKRSDPQARLDPILNSRPSYVAALLGLDDDPAVEELSDQPAEQPAEQPAPPALDPVGPAQPVDPVAPAQPVEPVTAAAPWPFDPASWAPPATPAETIPADDQEPAANPTVGGPASASPAPGTYTPTSS